MADYTAPFHMPKFADKKYLEKKAAYVREHGYTITFPNVSDIIHLGIAKPMTGQEKALWYTAARREIPRARQLELYAQKERGRANYKRIMASPIPNWTTNYTSVLTAADDFQDAIISLAAIGRIAAKFLPRILARVLCGPIAGLWLLAEIMSILMAPAACALNPLGCKRMLRRTKNRRVGSLKVRPKGYTPEELALLKRDRRMYRKRHPGEKVPDILWPQRFAGKMRFGMKNYPVSGGFLPSFAEGIQMAQVSDNIFGVGLSIGPAFGLAYDLMSGGVRWARGEKVSFARAPADVEIFHKAADKMHSYARWRPPKTKMTRSEFLAWKEKKIAAGTWGVRSQQDDLILRAQRMHQTYGGVLRKTDYMQETLFYCGSELAGQGVKNVLDWWNPIENVEGLEHIEIEAYNEPNPLIEEMLIEEGRDPDAGIAWPSLGKRWATYEEIQTSTAEVATENFRHFVDTCPSELLSSIAEQSALEGGLHNIAMLEGQETIDIQYHAGITTAEILLDNRYTFPRTITSEQINDLALWIQAHEDNDTRPGLKEILMYAKNSLGFEFVTKM